MYRVQVILDMFNSIKSYSRVEREMQVQNLCRAVWPVLSGEHLSHVIVQVDGERHILGLL